METVEKVYKITKEECQAKIHGVCDQCGGELEPIETVDNANNPTYWAGCTACSKFHWGTSKEVYNIAVKLVDESFWVPYSHMDHPDALHRQNDPLYKEYKEYYRKSQIAGACAKVRDVIYWQEKLKTTKS